MTDSEQHLFRERCTISPVTVNHRTRETPELLSGLRLATMSEYELVETFYAIAEFLDQLTGSFVTLLFALLITA